MIITYSIIYFPFLVQFYFFYLIELECVRIICAFIYLHVILQTIDGHALHEMLVAHALAAGGDLVSTE